MKERELRDAGKIITMSEDTVDSKVRGNKNNGDVFLRMLPELREQRDFITWDGEFVRL